MHGSPRSPEKYFLCNKQARAKAKVTIMQANWLLSTLEKESHEWLFIQANYFSFSQECLVFFIDAMVLGKILKCLHYRPPEGGRLYDMKVVSGYAFLRTYYV